MTSYISFVKERKETVKFDKIEDKLTNENLFCKENAFLSQKNEEKPDEEDENYLKIDENEEEKFDYSELSEEDKNQNEDLVNEITNKEKKNLDIDSKITKSQIIDIEKYKENLNPDSTINSKKRKFSEPTDSHIINIIKKIK